MLLANQALRECFPNSDLLAAHRAQERMHLFPDSGMVDVGEVQEEEQSGVREEQRQ